MSKENVRSFLKQIRDDETIAGTLARADAAQVMRTARELGFEFDEAQLRSVLKEVIYNAGSLPRPWGWSVARDLGIVRS